MGQGDLHAATLAGDGVDHLHRDAVAVHGHAHVDVGEVGVLRNVAAVDGPGHTVAQINHQGHIPASEGFKDFLIQLGAAAGKIHRHRLARICSLNGINRFFAHRWRRRWIRLRRPFRPVCFVACRISRNCRHGIAFQCFIIIPASKGVASTGDIRWQGGLCAVGIVGDIAAVDGAAFGVQRHLVGVRRPLSVVGFIAKVSSGNTSDGGAAKRCIIIPAIKGVAGAGDVLRRWQCRANTVNIADNIFVLSNGAAIGFQFHISCPLCPVFFVTDNGNTSPCKLVAFCKSIAAIPTVKEAVIIWRSKVRWYLNGCINISIEKDVVSLIIRVNIKSSPIDNLMLFVKRRD